MLDYWLHLGLQCYDREFLKLFPKMPATPMQMQEDLEQLKVIENGYKIKVIRVNHCAARRGRAGRRRVHREDHRRRSELRLT